MEQEQIQPNKNKMLTAVAVLVIIILASVFFGYQFFWQVPAEQNEVDNAALQAEADRINPFNQTSGVNPFDEGSNPYENIKTNPFE